jgi:Arc/MetJ family transcription regulator
MAIYMVKEADHMPRMVKKTIELDQDYIDTARLIFGVRTEKEAVNKALEMAVIDNQIIETHESIGGKGDLIEDFFE